MDNNQQVYRHSKGSLIGGLVVGFLLIWLFGVGLIIMIIAWLKYKYEFVTLDRHSVAIHKGWLTKTTTEIPYNKINSVSLAKNKGSVGNVTISTGNDIARLTLLSIEGAALLRDELQKRIGGLHVNPGNLRSDDKTDSRITQLEKLAMLKSGNVITEAEFQKEKARILDQ